MTKKLAKSRKNRMIDGVCGGIANFFGIDPTIIRLIWVAAVLLKGAGIILYIIAAIVMPYSDDYQTSEEDVENLKSANVDGESNSETEGDKSTKKSTKKRASKGTAEAPHSNEEFDKFFKKD